jgi:Flp pilus assembly protein TadD
MKRLLALVLVTLLAALSPARAEGPDDIYLRIFSLIQDGDTLKANGDIRPALAKYNEAQTALKNFQRGYPDWNPKVVTFRLDYLASHIVELQAAAPTATAAATTNSAAAANPSLAVTFMAKPPGTTEPAKPVAPDDSQDQLNKLTAQVARLQAERDQLRADNAKLLDDRNGLQSDKSLLESKLKEALTLQPAVDPADLTRAQEQLKSAQTENEQLRASLEKAKSSQSSEWAVEKAALEEKLKASQKDIEAAAALLAENQVLKKRVADLQTATPTTGKSGDLQRQLAQAQAQLAALESDKEVLRLQNTALEERVKQMTAAGTAATVAAAAAAPASNPGDAARIEKLQRERDDLEKKLQAAYKQLRNKKAPAATTTQVEDLQDQLARMQAKLDAFEARQVPYTTEELALLKQPEPKLAEPKPAKKSVHELPPAEASLVIEARHYFSEGKYDKAEENYQQVLKEDDKNVAALANLAAIEMERNRLDMAETNLTQALVLSPDDAYSLSVMGNLKFRQGKYDDALDVLSRAAKLDPNNAEIQNYLGLTFSEKGLRGPAETALRRAIQLEPGYGSAHNNLAVIYLTQQPPATELARWHYQRALAAGNPRNPDLERMLADKK